MVEIDALADESRALVTALHEVFFLEKYVPARQLLPKINENLLDLSAYFEEVSRIYRDHTQMMSEIDAFLNTEGALSRVGRDQLLLFREKVRGSNIIRDLQSFRVKFQNLSNSVHHCVERVSGCVGSGVIG